MEITYDIILKYLYKDKNIKKKINTIEEINEEKFKKILDNSFFRYGVYKEHNDNNISLLMSILFCIDEKYLNYTPYNIDEIINNYKINIKNIDDINIYITKLKLNIIIFNSNLNIYSIYSDNFFNPWKPTLLLYYDGKYYEPIYTNETKIFSYSSSKVNIFKNILCQDIIYYDKKKEFFVNDNINEILENDNLLNKNTKSDTFITSYDITKNITINKLNKMRKEEIIKLLDELNIPIQSNKLTKKELINKISEHYNIN
jgi:hypothetical protein